MNAAHVARAVEMAEVYAVLARRDRQFDIGTPAVVLAGVIVDAPAAERLHRFGVEVVAVTQRARLRDRATASGPAPEFTTKHTPGSDSRAVVQFRSHGVEIWPRSAPVDAIAGEVKFATEMNTLPAGEAAAHCSRRCSGFGSRADRQ